MNYLELLSIHAQAEKKNDEKTVVMTVFFPGNPILVTQNCYNTLMYLDRIKSNPQIRLSFQGCLLQEINTTKKRAIKFLKNKI